MSYDKNQFELAPPWLKDQNQPRKVKQNILTGGDSRQITGRLSSRSSSRDNSRTRIFKIKRENLTFIHFAEFTTSKTDFAI